ncbi:MAG: carbohydrate ABC transporter permease [Clostridiales bacterium]|nr:carbohydrate ABC transporter permease [Clostridiales bacterium]
MSKQKEDNSFLKINRIKPATNAFFSVFMSIVAVLTVVPVVLVFIISITSSESLTYRGFSFFPLSTSFVAYDSLFKTGSQLVDSYLVTIVVTVLHTFVSVLIMTMYAYVLAQQRFNARKFYTFMVFFTMLFSGGLVPSYIINVNVLHLYDTFWILVLSSMVSAFNIIVLRTFISTTIPIELFDAAQIDGASEFRIFGSIVIPLSKAGLATIGLFVLVGKWNEWFTGMLYIDNPKLVPLQTMLTRIQQQIDFIKNNSSLASSPDGMALLKNMPSEQTRMAILVLTTVPVLFAYPFFQRFFIHGMTIGSVKG